MIPALFDIQPLSTREAVLFQWMSCSMSGSAVLAIEQIADGFFALGGEFPVRFAFADLALFVLGGFLFGNGALGAVVREAWFIRS